MCNCWKCGERKSRGRSISWGMKHVLYCENDARERTERAEREAEQRRKREDREYEEEHQRIMQGMKMTDRKYLDILKRQSKTAWREEIRFRRKRRIAFNRASRSANYESSSSSSSGGSSRSNTPTSSRANRQAREEILAQIRYRQDLAGRGEVKHVHTRTSYGVHTFGNTGVPTEHYEMVYKPLGFLALWRNAREIRALETRLAELG